MILRCSLIGVCFSPAHTRPRPIAINSGSPLLLLLYSLSYLKCACPFLLRFFLQSSCFLVLPRNKHPIGPLWNPFDLSTGWSFYPLPTKHQVVKQPLPNLPHVVYKKSWRYVSTGAYSVVWTRRYTINMSNAILPHTLAIFAVGSILV